jgi:hypothetical protein
MRTRAELVGALQQARAEYCLIETAAGGWALVVPALGARVLGAGLWENNAFWVSPSLEGCLEGRDWNAGGQRTWLAPELGPLGFFGTGESDWAVPPQLDPGAYRLVEADDRTARCRTACLLNSNDGMIYRLEIERRVEVLDSAGARPGTGTVQLRLRHSLRNTGDRPIPARVGLWGIVQIPSSPEGSLLLPDAPLRPYFGELPPSWVRREAGRLVLRTAPARRYKVGQHPMGTEAVIAHHRPEAGLLVRMCCPSSPAGPYLDGPPSEAPGDALQAYNSPLTGDEAFCELECHAPAPHLEPGAESGAELEIEILRA